MNCELNCHSFLSFLVFVNDAHCWASHCFFLSCSSCDEQHWAELQCAVRDCIRIWLNQTIVRQVLAWISTYDYFVIESTGSVQRCWWRIFRNLEIRKTVQAPLLDHSSPVHDVPCINIQNLTVWLLSDALFSVLVERLKSWRIKASVRGLWVCLLLTLQTVFWWIRRKPTLFLHWLR